jgi:hypothetical protein
MEYDYSEWLQHTPRMNLNQIIQKLMEYDYSEWLTYPKDESKPNLTKIDGMQSRQE